MIVTRTEMRLKPFKPQVAVTITYSDMSESEAKAFSFDDWGKSLAAQGKITGSLPIEASGHQGMRWDLFKDADGVTVAETYDVYLVGSRVYVLVVSGPLAANDYMHPARDFFFDSFRAWQ
jgi:hypothetical protein